jgi:hypothetical protein
MYQVVEHTPSNRKALSLTPSTIKEKKNSTRISLDFGIMGGLFSFYTSLSPKFYTINTYIIKGKS